jgi:hypothetical protein
LFFLERSDFLTVGKSKSKSEKKKKKFSKKKRIPEKWKPAIKLEDVAEDVVVVVSCKLVVYYVAEVKLFVERRQMDEPRW